MMLDSVAEYDVLLKIARWTFLVKSELENVPMQVMRNKCRPKEVSILSSVSVITSMMSADYLTTAEISRRLMQNVSSL